MEGSTGHRAIHTSIQPGAPAQGLPQQQAAGAEPRKGCRDPVCMCVVRLCILSCACLHPYVTKSRDLSSNVVHRVLCMLYPYVTTPHLQAFLAAFLVQVVGIVYLAINYGATAIRHVRRNLT